MPFHFFFQKISHFPIDFYLTICYYIVYVKVTAYIVMKRHGIQRNNTL